MALQRALPTKTEFVAIGMDHFFDTIPSPQPSILSLKHKSLLTTTFSGRSSTSPVPPSLPTSTSLGRSSTSLFSREIAFCFFK